MEIRTIGIDLGKTVFHLVGFNARGEVVVRKKCSRTPYCRHPCKSLSSEKHEFSGRAPESARCIDRESFAAHECLSAGGPCVPAGPDIHLQSRALESRHR
jgi:hypothetical protein